MNAVLERPHTANGWAISFTIFAVGCSPSPNAISTSDAAAAGAHFNAVALDGANVAAPVDSLNGARIPDQFRFITGRTTLRQVVRAMGRYTRVRGSGSLYFEYDLPDGSAVMVGPEWPFKPASRIRNVTFYPHASKITLAP